MPRGYASELRGRTSESVGADAEPSWFPTSGLVHLDLHTDNVLALDDGTLTGIVDKVSHVARNRREVSMNVTASAISLNVDDVTASADFAKAHFGFTEEMSADGFVSLARPDVGFNLVFLRIGLASFKPESMRGNRADGLLIAFVVDDIDREYARFQEEGVPITTPIETEPWGERYFQVTDPNGIVIQLVQWITEPSADG